MPNSCNEEMYHVRFPRDANTSPVAVQYIFDPNTLDVYPLGGVTLPDGSTARSGATTIRQQEQPARA